MSDHAGSVAASRSDSLGSTSTGLLAGVKARQPEAWSQLVDVYSPLVYGWCRRMGVAPGDTPDIVQEVFASVARRINDFRGDSPRGSFRAWLSSITRRRISDHFRAKLREPAAEGGTDAQARLLNVPESTLTLDAEEPAEESSLVWQRVVELVRTEFEPSTWQAFWRVAVDSMSPADAAQELGMSIPAVYKAKSRVLRRLRQALESLEQDQ